MKHNLQLVGLLFFVLAPMFWSLEFYLSKHAITKKFLVEWPNARDKDGQKMLKAVKFQQHQNVWRVWWCKCFSQLSWKTELSKINLFFFNLTSEMAFWLYRPVLSRTTSRASCWDYGAIHLSVSGALYETTVHFLALAENAYVGLCWRTKTHHRKRSLPGSRAMYSIRTAALFPDAVPFPVALASGS